MPQNVTLPLPETSSITFQRVKVEPQEKVEVKAAAKPQVFKLPTLSNTTTSTTSTNATQAKTAVRRTVTKTAVVTVKPNNKTNAIKTVTSDSNTATTLVTTQTTNSSSGGGGGGTKSDVPTCEICDKVFKRKEHLAQHVKLHLGLRPFQCTGMKIRKKKTKIQIEFYSLQNSINSFAEPNCNKAFSRKEHLMRHNVSHTGKKQFNCDICHKLFSRKDNLNKHKKLVAFKFDYICGLFRY